MAMYRSKVSQWKDKVDLEMYPKKRAGGEGFPHDL